MAPVNDNQDMNRDSLPQEPKRPLPLKADAPVQVAQPGEAVHSTPQIQAYQSEIELQNEEIRLTQRELEDARNKYAELYDQAPVGYIIINNSSHILEANLTFANMLGVSKAAIQEQGLRRFIHEADQDAYYFFHQKLFNEQVPQGIQLWLYRQNGTSFYALLEGVPIRGKLTAVSQARIAISDISELAQLRTNVEQKTDELIVTEAALEATSEAHARVQIEVERRIQVEAELRFLLELIEAVNAATHFDEALRIVLAALCIQESRIYGEVWLPNQEKTYLTLSPVFHLEEPQKNEAVVEFRRLSADLVIGPGDGIAGQSWKLGQLIWVEEIADLLDTQHSRREAQVAAGLHALLAVPIMAANEIVAVLLLYKNVPNNRDERFIALAAAAATQLGFVLQEKRAEMLLQQAHDELEERVAARTAELHQTNKVLEALISERQAAEERLQQSNQELELLHRFSLLITGRLDIDEILQPFATLLREELSIPSGFVFFFDRQRQQIYPHFSWGLSASEVRAVMRWPLGKNRLFQEAAEGEVILYRHLQDVAFFQERGLLAAHPNWQAFMGVPVTVGDRAFGAFGLFREAPLTFSEGELIFFKALAQLMRTAVQNARLFETVNDSREQLRRIARRVFLTQENERRRVSRELHDEAGQALTGLKIHLQMVLSSLNQIESELRTSALRDIKEQIETAVDLCQTTLEHIRNIAQDLRPAALENLGLNTALQAFCRDFAHRTQLAITYNSGQLSSQLPEAVEIGLYRCLQEALTNVARHAQAETVQVQLHYDSNTISLTVTDNGLGFDAAAVLDNAENNSGVGLAGMKERIESVGGRLNITSELGKGTTLSVWVPL